MHSLRVNLSNNILVKGYEVIPTTMYRFINAAVEGWVMLVCVKAQRGQEDAALALFLIDARHYI